MTQVMCGDCALLFDDAERSMICPHDRFLSIEAQAQKDLGLSLFGKDVVFNHEPDTAPPRRIQSCGWNGMVTIAGMSGEFAPSLFRVVTR